MHAFETYLKNARFLVIDDEPVSASAVEISLAAAGQEDVRIVNDPCDAIEAFREYRPGHHPAGYLHAGHGRLRGARTIARAHAARTITCRSSSSPRTRGSPPAAARWPPGASDFLTKPFGSTELRLRVRNLLETRFLHLGLREQNRRLDERVTERTQELEAALDELRQTQRQAIREQRLHAFSEMAGGVVHDFNNVLMILMSLTDLMAREAPPAPESDIGELRRDDAGACSRRPRK